MHQTSLHDDVGLTSDAFAAVPGCTAGPWPYSCSPTIQLAGGHTGSTRLCSLHSAGIHIAGQRAPALCKLTLISEKRSDHYHDTCMPGSAPAHVPHTSTVGHADAVSACYEQTLNAPALRLEVQAVLRSPSEGECATAIAGRRSSAQAPRAWIQDVSDVNTSSASRGRTFRCAHFAGALIASRHDDMGGARGVAYLG